MRRADRLFKLVQILRARRLSTGAQLAERLQVSLRTVYRDIADLQASGVPVVGEAGVGYALSERVDIPPLMFSREELVAMRFGLRMVEQWADGELGEAGRSALEKIVGALPRDRRGHAGDVPIFSMGKAFPVARLTPLRAAIEQRAKLRVAYLDEQGRASERVLWPLGLVHWGQVWTLTAWCELRGAFRDFRVDRMQSVEPAGEPFPVQKGRRLQDYWRLMEAQHGIRFPQEWLVDTLPSGGLHGK